MRVIPFPLAPAAEPISFALAARVDLRLGAPAAGVVRPIGGEPLSYTNLARLVRAARMAWRSRSAMGQINLAIPADCVLDAEALDEAAVEAGCTRKSLTFEFDERAAIAQGPDLAVALRARGWGVALRGDPACPIPFGSKARNLYTELVLDAPGDDDPFFAHDAEDRTPLCRRLFAAREAGLVITAENVRTQQHGRLLAIMGFDRGGGPFAEV